MTRLLVKQAADAFKRGDYEVAEKLYQELSYTYGPTLFTANLEIIKRRLERAGVQRKLPVHASSKYADVIKLEETESEYKELLSNPIWVELPIGETDFCSLSFDVIYENISEPTNRRSLAIVEYLDASKTILEVSYAGLTKSESVGWFKYLGPTSKKNPSLYLQPPVGASYARVGLRSYYVKNPQRVLISNLLYLTWLDNRQIDPSIKGDNGAPIIEPLPFELPQPQTQSRLKVAAILDNFSFACFEPECDLIPVTPSKWREELLGQKIDLLLVESAWHGNSGAWDYRVAKYAKPPDSELLNLIHWAERFEIPTVFWNKEDPPNFDRFIDTAKHFKYIFTTDQNCTEKYKKIVSPGTYVGVLPFAAQPKIHNPEAEQERLNRTCFAGTYYADDFAPRRQAMDMLLRNAAKFGLDIFDRMHGTKGKDRERFQFPNDLRQYVQGSLTYDEMLGAYRRYRVGLNVNSVTDSPTMFSRRVFELLACGTPVISTPSLGISRFFGELVPTVGTDKDAGEALSRLMEDDTEWLRRSVMGMRLVFSKHTYAHRLGEISKVLGLGPVRDSISAPVVVVQPVGHPQKFAECMSKQVLRPREIIVIGNRYGDDSSETHVVELKAAGIRAIALPRTNIVTYLRHRHSEVPVAICNTSCRYGPGYLLDAAISLISGRAGSASAIAATDFTNSKGIQSIAYFGRSCEYAQDGTLFFRQDHPLFEAQLMGSAGGPEGSMPLSVRSRPNYDFEIRANSD